MIFGEATIVQMVGVLNSIADSSDEELEQRAEELREFIRTASELLVFIDLERLTRR